MIKPLGERIVAKVKEKDMTTASGIVLPDTAKEKPQEGEVVNAELSTSEDENFAYASIMAECIEKAGEERKILR